MRGMVPVQPANRICCCGTQVNLTEMCLSALQILTDQEFIQGAEFSVADVAVGSTLCVTRDW